MRALSRLRSLATRVASSNVARVGAVGGLGLSLAGKAMAQATPYAVPTELQPATVADQVFGIVAPFIPIMVAIGVTLLITVVIYHVITRKVAHFGNVA